MDRKERLKQLDETHVGMGFVERVGKSYEKFRQKAVSAAYKVWGGSVFPERHKNWRHFYRTAVVIQELGASTENYMAAQFLTATPTSYPYPSNLYSKRSIENYKAAVSSVGVKETLKVMELHLENYESRFGVSREEIVYWNHLGFKDWFRVLHMDPDDIPLSCAKQALKSFKDPGIRAAIEENGYDIVSAEKGCLRRVEQECKM